MKIRDFNLTRGRIGTIFIGKEKCNMCKQTTNCLDIGIFESENEIGYICQDCIINCFKKFYKLNVEN